MTNDVFEQLAQKLERAKEAEEAAKQARILVEAEIYEAALEQGPIPDKGTTHHGRLTISTGFTESWDQDLLADLAGELPPEHFPFKPKFACNKRALTVLAEQHPQVYRRIFAALTTKPKKPSFSVKAPETEKQAAA